MTVLVTGATGCIGHALTTRLVENGEWGTVRALVRPGSDTSDLPPGVEIIFGTLEDNTDALCSAVRGVDTIFHAAAKVHAPKGSAEEFDRINAGGTDHLLRACVAEKVSPRFLYYSTVAVYGEETPPDGIPENAPVAPISPYAKSKVRAESVVSEWGRQNYGVPTILRVATVYGPRDRGNMARMIGAVAKGRFLLPDGGQNRKTCVSVENVVRISLAVVRASADAVGGKTLVVADPSSPYKLCVLADAMAEALQIPSRVPSAPNSLLSLVASPLTLLFGARSPITKDQIRRLAANNVYIPATQHEIIDDSALIPLSEGIKNAVLWWKRGTNPR